MQSTTRSIYSHTFYTLAGVLRRRYRRSSSHSLFIHWRERDPRINGPFKTTEELHLGIALHSRKQQELNDRHPWGSEWFARHLPRVLKDHPSTFTHSDLFKQNIMVQEQLVADNQTYQAV